MPKPRDHAHPRRRAYDGPREGCYCPMDDAALCAVARTGQASAGPCACVCHGARHAHPHTED